MTFDSLIEKVVSQSQRNYLLLITSLGWAVVAAYVMITSFTLPLLAQEWNLSNIFASTIASSTFIGMFIGTLSAGIISDYFGRKKSAMFLLFIGSFFSVLSGFIGSPTLFIIFRILSGIGFGGSMPVLNAYLTEFLNVSIRGKYLVYLESSWAIGSIFIAVIHMFIARNFTWRLDYIFLGAGFIPFLLLLTVPESPKYLLIREKKEEFEKLFNYNIKEKIIVPKKEKVTIKALFQKGYLVRSLNILLLWFTMSFGYYGIFVWVKGILAQKGVDVVLTDWYTFYMFLAQLPGYLLAAYLIEKIGRRKSVLLFALGTAISSVIFASVSSNILVLIFSLVVSIFCMGEWGLTYAYTPELYPTTMRGTANGVSGALTRFSGFIAPFYTSYFLERGNINIGLIGIAILFLLTGILNFIFLPETLKKEVD
jgi:putative MFS transporter